jgi:hypothetical protein
MGAKSRLDAQAKDDFLVIRLSGAWQVSLERRSLTFHMSSDAHFISRRAQ